MAAGLVRPWAVDLDLGAVDPQLDALGSGVREHVCKRAKPQVGLAGNGEAPGGKQWPDLVNSAGDCGAVHVVEQGQGGVWELKAQDHQGGDHSIGEHQLVVRSGTGRAQTLVASTFVEPPCFGGHPGAGQLSDQRTESTPGQTGADAMGKGRAGQVLRHNNTQPAVPRHVTAHCCRPARHGQLP